jgi:hypothetical protein
MNGEGIHFVPEIGAICYICKSSDNARLPFLLLAGTATVPKDYSDQGGAPGSMDMFRPFLSPGDIALFTRDGNGLTLRRGGVTELRGTSLSKILFNPMKNQVLTIAENYKVQTFGGTVEWKNLQREKDPDGAIRTVYTLKAKEFATSKGYSVHLRMGTTEEDPITLQTGDTADVEVTTPEIFPFTLAGDGSTYPVTLEKVTALNDSARVVDFRIYADETVDETDLSHVMNLGMDREGDIQLETDGAMKIDASTKWVEFVVGGSIPAIKDDLSGVQKVLVTTGTQGSTEPVILGETFLTDLSSALTEISVGLNAIGIPTPEAVTLLANIATSMAVGGTYLSTTLESE